MNKLYFSIAAFTTSGFGFWFMFAEDYSKASCFLIMALMARHEWNEGK